MDDLWHSANQDTLNKFSDKLKKLYRNLEKSALLIEEDHYQKLVNSLDVFANFQFGKQKLIDLQSYTKGSYVPNISERIGVLISDNEQHRKNLNQVMQNLMDEMRIQINGNRKEQKNLNNFILEISEN
jgi:3'-phosphoadenosine 5'-phosphosulfate sulfotransferase (PAPS reductase)/FAD synthetase